MLASGRSSRQIVEEGGLAQISDTAVLEQIVAQVLDEHPEHVDRYLGGKGKVIGWLMGQVMKATRGKANPQAVRELLQAQLEDRRH